MGNRALLRAHVYLAIALLDLPVEEERLAHEDEIQEAGAVLLLRGDCIHELTPTEMNGSGYLRICIDLDQCISIAAAQRRGRAQE
jgi:hypothetical protein